MNVLNSIFKGLSWLVIAVIIVMLLMVAPVIAGFRPVVILSGSMEPAYPVGCVTYYKACDFSEIREGDAITFRAGDSMVTHRAVKVNGLSGTVVTKGDHNLSEDPNPVDRSKIAGKTVKFKIPFGGYVVTGIRQPAAISMMVLILLISFILEKLVGKKEGRKRA